METNNNEKQYPPIQLIISAALIFTLTYKTPYSGIGACIAEGIFLYTIFHWSKKEARPLRKEAWYAGGIAFLYALMDVMTTSTLANSLNMAGFWVSNIFFVGLGFGLPMIQRHPLSLLKELLKTLYQGLPISSLRKFLHMPDEEKTRPILKGVIIAIPILIIFFGLFSMADQNFARASMDVLASITGRNTVELIYGSVVFVALLTGLLLIKENLFGKYLIFDPQEEKAPSIQQESSIVLSLVNLLFCAFLLVQSQYLFGGEGYRYENNLNYADYAVSGFYELMIVVGLVIFMSISLRTFHKEAISKTQKILYCLLLSQSMIILCSALIRMHLYIDVYGYTQSRIFGVIFILAAGVGLLLTMHNIFREEAQHKLIKRLLLTGAISSLLFGTVQPDLNSARWNLARQASEQITSERFFHENQSRDVGTVLALIEIQPQAKADVHYEQFCTVDPRSFQFNRFQLCQRLK